MRICFMRGNWQANGMSPGKNYRLGFRLLRFYYSTTSTFNQLQDLHLWVNASFRCSAFSSRKWGVWIIWDSSFCQMSQGDQETKNSLDSQTLSIEEFFKNYLQWSKAGMEICMGIFFLQWLFTKPHPVQKDWCVHFFPTPWNTCKERSYECVLHVNSADKKKIKVRLEVII